jgi:hypothetical protein
MLFSASSSSITGTSTPYTTDGKPRSCSLRENPFHNGQLRERRDACGKMSAAPRADRQFLKAKAASG